MNDPTGNIFPRLWEVTPALQAVFAAAYITLPEDTRAYQPEQCERIQRDPFYRAFSASKAHPPGQHFLALYSYAAAACDPTDILHLCYPDRLIHALMGEHRETFLEDVSTLQPKNTPLIYARSASAWATHPRNYRDLEEMVTTTGKHLFGKVLDFGWCHMAVRAGKLGEILPLLCRQDMSMVAEMVLHLLQEVRMQEVDWLGWEDPFVLGLDPEALRTEREQSTAETCKRLGYVVPMIELLASWDANCGKV